MPIDNRKLAVFIVAYQHIVARQQQEEEDEEEEELMVLAFLMQQMCLLAAMVELRAQELDERPRKRRRM